MRYVVLTIKYDIMVNYKGIEVKSKNVLVVNMNEGNRQSAPGRLELVRTFLNTWRIPNQTRVLTEFLLTQEDVERFQTEHFPHLTRTVARDTVIQLRSDLRETIAPGKGDISELNSWLRLYPFVARIGYSRTESESEVCYQPIEEQRDLCAELLVIVVQAIERKMWSRLKACPDCRLVFYDYTKNVSKVWCGMLANGPQGRACGSIAKVRHWRKQHQTKKDNR